MQASKEDNSFKSLIKGTSIFGGVQVFQILINLIRGKFIALLLGPDGMGVNSMYVSSTALIQQFASLGINLSIVKEIASDKNTDNPNICNTTIHISIKLIFLTAILGFILCLIFSPVLSKLTFGDYSHIVEFAILSLMVFFTIASAGLSSILQGLHVIKILSKATLVGCITGLIVGVPLYYIFGIKGIVPSMIILSISTFTFNLIGLKKTITISWNPIDLNQYKDKVKHILRLGFVLMAGTLIGTACTYLLNIIIREYGSIEAVGLYQSANSITNQYVGLIFTAMSLDYFPRLSAISTDNLKMRELVNRQIIVTCIIVVPLLCLLILTAPLVIKLILADSFLSVVPLVRWLALGLLFRSMCYPLGYITFAKGNEKRYFLLEGIFGNIIFYSISILMFIRFGKLGLGIGLSIVYTINFILLLILNNKWYEFKLEKTSLNKMLIACFFVISCFICTNLNESWFYSILSFLITLISIIYSYIIIRTNAK